MAEKRYDTSPSSDRDVVAGLQRIMEALGSPPASGTLFGNFEGTGEQSTDLLKPEDHAFFRSVLAHHGAYLKQIRVQFAKPWQGAFVAITRTDDNLDSVHINYPEAIGPDRILTLISATEQVFPRLRKFGDVEKTLGPEIAEFYRHREATLTELQRISETLIRDNEAFRRQLDEERATTKRELGEDFDRRRGQLEAEYTSQRTAVEEREREIDRLRKELDDRSSRHARRDSRRDFKKAIEARGEKFTLSQATGRKRWPIHLIFAALLLMLGSVAVQGLFWPHKVDGAPDWFPAARSGLSVLAFALSAAFYIRWNDAWFRQHADEEFRLRRMDLDIDRAHYVVEMLLEWNEEKGTVIPNELIRSLTVNLFGDSESDAIRHPYEDLAALLGASAGVKLKLPSGSEVQFNKGGLRKMEQDARPE